MPRHLLRLQCMCLPSGWHLTIANPVYSLEAAASTPETLSQEAIIENLDPTEAARLDRVRNIGIAVCPLGLVQRSSADSPG